MSSNSLRIDELEERVEDREADIKLLKIELAAALDKIEAADARIGWLEDSGERDLLIDKLTASNQTIDRLQAELNEFSDPAEDSDE